MTTFIVMCCGLILLLVRQLSKRSHIWLIVIMLWAGMAHGQSWTMGQPSQGFHIVPMGAGCGMVTGIVQQQLLPMFDHPQNWTLILACDDNTWMYIQERAPRTAGRTDYAFTDLERGYTYIRGSKLVHPDFGSRTRPEFILAHEAGHVLAHCPADKKGEALADRIAQQLLSHQPVVIASK